MDYVYWKDDVNDDYLWLKKDYQLKRNSYKQDRME